MYSYDFSFDIRPAMILHTKYYDELSSCYFIFCAKLLHRPPGKKQKAQWDEIIFIGAFPIILCPWFSRDYGVISGNLEVRRYVAFVTQ